MFSSRASEKMKLIRRVPPLTYKSLKKSCKQRVGAKQKGSLPRMKPLENSMLDVV